MSFCKGALTAVRKIWNEITPFIETVLTTITTVTGQILLLEKDPSVEAILALIPKGSEIEGWINSALNTILGLDSGAEDIIKKITAFLDALDTKAAKDAGVFKLASMATKSADAPNNADGTKTDSFYDSAVQLHVMMNKG